LHLVIGIMDAIAIHLEIRNALSLADELARHAHNNGNGSDFLAGQLNALRSMLSELERDVGRTHLRQFVPNPAAVESMQHVLDSIRAHVEEFQNTLRPRLGLLLEAVERIVYASMRPTSDVPAKTLLRGVLPLSRVLPQDVHSVVDYIAAGAYFASATLARTRSARIMGSMLGASLGGGSLLTDDRLGAKKIIAVENHEVLDHVSGATAILAPFVLGYVKKDPIASAIQILAGVTTILSSLFTDYRATRGLGRPIRSRGGPDAVRMRVGRRGIRVSEVQRPLEGLSAPSSL
jgi:hypothetical protein